MPQLTAQKAERINQRSVLVVLGFCFVAAHAGGNGLVPLAVIAGIVGLFTCDVAVAKEQFFYVMRTRWILALGLFLGWALLSVLWSPYEPRGLNNAIKLSVAVIFFEAARRAFKRASIGVGVSRLNGTQTSLLYLPIVAGVLLLFDIISGFGLSYAIDPPAGPSDAERRKDAIMNTSNGIIFLVLMSAPSIILFLWSKYRGPIFAVLLLVLIFGSALTGGLNVAIVALILSVMSMLLAALYPRLVISVLTATAMMLVGFAPLISALSQWTSPAFRDLLPFSWEHRLVSWSYVGDRIREHPFIGHGFDSSRTFDATFSARGFENMSVISLHPHNAGLHIWLETGGIGALFAVVMIKYLGANALNYSEGGRARSMAVAGLIAPIILIATVSYGVWQYWWWASLFVSTGVLYLVPQTKKLAK